MRIRAAILSIAVAAASALPVGAQGGVVWSGYVGTSTSRLGTNQSADASQRGLTVGFGWAHQPSHVFAFEVGGELGQRGGLVEFEGGRTSKLRIDYLDVPISIRWEDPLFVRLGVVYSNEHHCAVAEDVVIGEIAGRVVGSTLVQVQSSGACAQARSRRTDFAPFAGLGVILRDGPVQLTLEVRKWKGMSLSSSESTANARSRATAILFGLGFKEP